MAEGNIRDTTLSAFIWKNAEDLWGDFKHTDFGKIILPFTLLRRLECVLEPTRDAVLTAHQAHKESGIDVDLILRQITRLPFYNTSQYSLSSLGGTKTRQNLEAYIAGFSDNARVIFEQFDFGNTIARLAKSNVLFKICQNFARTDLHPNAVPDRVMSNVYEHLIRRFGSEVNEAAEDFMTPRDVVHLATTLLLDPDDKLFRDNPGLIRTLYDPTCGTGGFLTDAMNHVDTFRDRAKVPPVLIPYGQELEPETHAVALAGMLLRTLESDPGRDLSRNIAGPASTLSDDRHVGERFHYCLSNPPFGKKWEKDQEAVLREEREKGFTGRFGAGTPRVTDGSMLFLQHLVSKMERPERGGGRAAIILSGSPLFNGNAGQGESEIRRWLLEKDYVEAIVALPTDIFFRTGLGTFIWILSNKKTKNRRGKVQLIDATEFHSPMPKGEGNKRRYISPQQIHEIAHLYSNFEEGEKCRIVPYEDFGYRRVRVQRPLRIALRISKDGIERLKEDNAWSKLDDTQQAKLEHLLLAHAEESQSHAWIETLVDASAGKKSKQLFKALVSVLGKRDPDGEVILKDGKPIVDKALDDFEHVPFGADIKDHVRDTVCTYLPDSFVDETYCDDKDGQVGKVGYEINFSRYFYRYSFPRTLQVIDEELKDTEARISNLLSAQSRIAEVTTQFERIASGVEWIREIPPHWKTCRVAAVFEETNERGGTQDELLAVSQSHGIMPQAEYASMLDRRLSQSESGDYSNYKRVRPGDFVYNKMRMWQGAIGVAPVEGCVSPAYVTFRPRREIAPSYWAALFKSPNFLVEVSKVSQGICDDQNSCKFEEFREILVPLPPVEEQHAIAEFIESRRVRTDELVALTQRSTALMKERQEAITTGLVTGFFQQGSLA